MIQKFPFITEKTGDNAEYHVYVDSFNISITNGFRRRHGCRCAFMSDNASALSFMGNSER